VKHVGEIDTWSTRSQSSLRSVAAVVVVSVTVVAVVVVVVVRKVEINGGEFKWAATCSKERSLLGLDFDKQWLRRERDEQSKFTKLLKVNFIQFLYIWSALTKKLFVENR